MPALLKIIHKIWIQKFYERHAVLLGLVFYVMFFLVNSGEIIDFHFNLIVAVLSSFKLLLLIFGIWFLYQIKMIFFFEECLSLPQNIILKKFELLSRSNQFRLYAYALLLAYMPVFIYSSVMIVIAFRYRLFLAGLSIVGFQAGIISLGAWRLLHTINSCTPSIFKIPSFRWKLIKPFPLFYIDLLVNRFKITFLLTKIFSVLGILGFMQLPVDHYEPRLAWLGFTFGFSGHYVILYEWRKFEDRNLFFSRALPLAIHSRFVMLGIAYALLLLPEWGVMIAQGLGIYDATVGWLMGISFLLFIHGSSYRSALDNEQLMQNMLWLFLITFLMVLSQLSLPFSLLLLAVAAWRFRKNFDGYQPADFLA
ncbi:MAG: hypothetical protein JST69_09135 [Bacteroidetes bacterium]|nr:hypothetical protein [Bacteroidota bacterium]